MDERERTEPLLLRAEEVGSLLRVSKSMVLKMVASGELPAVRLGSAVRIPAALLRDWVRERTAIPKGTPSDPQGNDREE